MAGGTHAGHADVEVHTLETYSATSVPYTDAQIDALCVAAEAGILTYLPAGSALPTAADAKWKQLIVAIVLNMMDIATIRKGSRGKSSVSSDTGSETFPRFGLTAYTFDIIKRAETLLGVSGSITYGDLVSS